MARAFSVSVAIGARVASSFGASVSAAERRIAGMARSVKLRAAEMKVALRGVDEAQGARRTRMFEGAAAGFLGARALAPFVNFEDSLVRMGNTAQVHGSTLDRAGKQIQDIGQRFGFAGRDAIVGANDFVAAGESLTTAVQALAPTLKLAKVAGVDTGEASQSGIALMQNLGLRVRDLGAAFDIMAKAGKEGRFEINDMARAFPGLASRAKLLGMVGLDGVKRMSAMLQVTRMNARDAEEAENNLLNFLDKLTGAETLDHFGKLGVSIEKVLARSKRNGTDFVDDMLAEIGRLTSQGTDAIALTTLFPDRQARQAVLALVTQRKELERIRAALGSGTAGTLDKDFGFIQGTARFGLDRMLAGLDRGLVAFGKAFGPALGDAAEGFANLAERFGAWADKNPGIVRAIGFTVAGLVALRTASAALGFAFGGVMGRIAKFLAIGLWKKLFVAIGATGPRMPWIHRIGAGIASLWVQVSRLRGLGSVFRAAFSPLGAFASAGAKAVGPMFAAGLRATGPFFAAGLRAVAPFLLGGLRVALGLISGPVGWALLAASAVTLAYRYRASIAAAWRSVTGWFTNTAWPAVAATASALTGWGSKMVTNIIVGLAGSWGRLKSWVANKWRETMPTWIGGGPALAAAANDNAPARVGRAAGGRLPNGPRLMAPTPRAFGPRPVGLAGKRALGGPVAGGKTYLVGERGPELFTAERSGVIVPDDELTRRRATVQARSGADTYNYNFTINGARDPRETAREVESVLRRMAGRQSARLSD